MTNVTPFLTPLLIRHWPSTVLLTPTATPHCLTVSHSLRKKDGKKTSSPFLTRLWPRTALLLLLPIIITILIPILIPDCVSLVEKERQSTATLKPCLNHYNPQSQTLSLSLVEK